MVEQNYAAGCYTCDRAIPDGAGDIRCGALGTDNPEEPHIVAWLSQPNRDPNCDPGCPGHTERAE